MLVDVHSHVTPFEFPACPGDASRARWPCMHRPVDAETVVMQVGGKPFRKLDRRSWDGDARVADMDRDGVAVQVLSPMPELLSYWMPLADGETLCQCVNEQIATMLAAQPRRFRGLGAVPLQSPERAAGLLARLKRDFGFCGVEIGSNINGLMLGDARFEPFYAEAEALGMAVFVHALHPVSTQHIESTPLYTGCVGFPLDVAMAAASLMTSGTLDKFPRLRIGFSHGGGALGSILGRLDVGWEKTGESDGGVTRRPSELARALFYDSNVYAPRYLRYIVDHMAPGRVFLGTDYPYDIMQRDPRGFIEALGYRGAAKDSLHSGAAAAFLGECFDPECGGDARADQLEA